MYLMDEPLSSLDAKLRAEMRIELKRVHRELSATILYVTHDQTEAMTMATRIGVLEQGRLVQFGTPREIYQDPRNVHVATRLGSPGVNLVPRELFPDVPKSLMHDHDHGHAPHRPTHTHQHDDDPSHG